MSAVTERSRTRVESAPHTVISPWRPGVWPRLTELWRYRRLMPYMWKEFILRRYRATYLAWIWIPLRPAIDIASRTLLFGGFLQVGSGDRPYFIFIAFASAGWQLFDSSLKWATRAVRRGKSIAGDLYFPRTALITGAIAPAIVDFILYAAVAIIGTVYYLVVQGDNYLAPPKQWLVAVLGLGILMLYGMAIGLFTSPLAMITKEVRYFLGYVMQFWYYVTPVVYSTSSLPQQYRWIAVVNPITAPIEMVKFGFLSTAPPETISLISCFIMLPVLLFGGLRFFSRFEHAAVDRL
jgi:lipopolysaccharide transport system permease protein